jgi:DUF971 family protein
MRPTEIKVHKKSATLELVYQDDSFLLSAEYLRVFSPSAEVQGHAPGQQVLQHGKRLVTFKDILIQGHYAIRISFSDGHDTGIYSWDYLQQLGNSELTNWQDYLNRLAAAGVSRDPQFIALN